MLQHPTHVSAGSASRPAEVPPSALAEAIIASHDAVAADVVATARRVAAMRELHNLAEDGRRRAQVA